MPYASLAIDRMESVPMRDGTILRADVFRPAGAGARPAVLCRTPYGRSNLGGSGTFALQAASAGYAVVLQDVRGCKDSGGDLTPFVDERDDGFDTLEWIVSQPWCDGNVGMFGGSYSGVTQWQAAMSGHPGLKAIVPSVTSSDYHQDWTYRGGAFQLGFSLGWTVWSMAWNRALRLPADDPATAWVHDDLLDGHDALPERARHLPLGDHAALDAAAPYYREWLEHPSYDEFWERLDVSRAYDEMTVAAFDVGAWYDIFLLGTLENYTGMRARGRAPQRLLVGPWAHDDDTATGERYFGGRASRPASGADELRLRWFDRFLRGEDNGVDTEPPVRLYAMGTGEWRSFASWPVPGTEVQDWYLHSGGSANTLDGDGVLSREEPGASQPSDRFAYDPRDPVPTHGGGLCGSFIHTVGGVFDQRVVEVRDDVLVYTSAPLAEPLDVTGPVKVILHASTDGPDTDWTAKLVDVEPDGYARNLCDGILRARYRESMRAPTLLAPGAIHEYEIDLGATSNVFGPGHRLRLEVSSSNFPHFDRNPNTGAVPGTGTELRVARQEVHHAGPRLSRVVLPVLPA